MSTQCNEIEFAVLAGEPFRTLTVRCTLPLGHNESHRAVIFWPSTRDLVSIDEVWEDDTDSRTQRQIQDIGRDDL